MKQEAAGSNPSTKQSVGMAMPSFRAAADGAEIAHGIADRQDGVGMDAFRQAEGGPRQT